MLNVGYAQFDANNKTWVSNTINDYYSSAFVGNSYVILLCLYMLVYISITYILNKVLY